MQKIKLKFLLPISALVGLGLLLSACRDYGSTPSDRTELQKICNPVRDVPAAFEAHKKVHGSYPLTINDLDMTLPLSAPAVRALKGSNGFVYSSAGDTFSIYKKLNWDGGVSFSGSNPKWVYSLNEDKEFPVY